MHSFPFLALMNQLVAVCWPCQPEVCVAVGLFDNIEEVGEISFGIFVETGMNISSLSLCTSEFVDCL